MTETIALATMWLVNTIYCVSLIPQIMLNVKMRSTHGLSDIMLFGYLAAFMCHAYYIFCLGFPLSYQVMVPLAMAGVFTMVVQRFYYNSFLLHTPYLALYAGLFGVALAVLPFAYFFPTEVGHLAGWLALILWSIYQLPQIIKIFRSKSVRGFSFPFITFTAVGLALELTSALLLRTPGDMRFMPLIFTSVRGLLIYGIYCIQFWLYGD